MSGWSAVRWSRSFSQRPTDRRRLASRLGTTRSRVLSSWGFGAPRGEASTCGPASCRHSSGQTSVSVRPPGGRSVRLDVNFGTVVDRLQWLSGRRPRGLSVWWAAAGGGSGVTGVVPLP
jgi:hypothetical protein